MRVAGSFRVVLSLWMCAPGYAPSGVQAQRPEPPARLYVVGQDLGALRGYFAADGLPKPDGTTAYLAFFGLTAPANAYGGLGLALDGQPIEGEGDWGAGPVNAAKSMTEFGAPHLAVGLSLADDPTGAQLDALIAGEHDDKILRLAQLCRHTPGTVYLRIGYEFDGAWNAAYADAARFKKAWRRIVEGLRAEGVENCAFVWQACASPHDDARDGVHEDIANWYPGDDVVDWLAFSWFMPPDTKLGYAPQAPTPRELADEVLALARAKGKPVMVAELAPQGFDLKEGTVGQIGQAWDGPPGAFKQDATSDQMWDRWFAPTLAYVHANADVIRALCYINCDWDAQALWGPPYDQGYWGDTRLQTRPELTRRWSEAIARWRSLPAESR